MRIVSVEPFAVPPQWMFVRVRTDEGVTGWGEAGSQFQARAVAGAVQDLGELLVGEDPLRIEHHWQVLTRAGFFRGGAILGSAVAALDLALWDIAGKVRGAPVHELMGGPVRERVRAYAWIAGDDMGELTPGQIAEEARGRVAEGFTAFKMSPGLTAPVIEPAHVEAILERVAAVREAIGARNDVALDLHGRCSRTTSRRLLPLLEPLQPLFVEEPVTPEHTDAFAELAALSAVPLATGERLHSRWDFRDVLGSGLAVAQPDVSQACGLSEVRRIAAMAEMHDVSVAPHCPLGPITLAASLQLDFAVPNVLVQEQGMTHFGAVFLDYLVDPEPLAIRDGWFSRPTGPGLGIEVDERAVERAADPSQRRHAPAWRHRDGSFAEW